MKNAYRAQGFKSIVKNNIILFIIMLLVIFSLSDSIEIKSGLIGFMTIYTIICILIFAIIKNLFRFSIYTYPIFFFIVNLSSVNLLSFFSSKTFVTVEMFKSVFLKQKVDISQFFIFHQVAVLFMSIFFLTVNFIDINWWRSKAR